MARMRMSMRKIREVLRLTHELGLSVREAREGGRAHVAYPAGDQRRRVGAMAVYSGGLPRGLHEAAARLDEGARRTQASRRDADDPVGGASRRVCRRPRIFPVLRALRRMEKAPVADDAADVPGGR